MNHEATLDALLAAWERGGGAPPELVGTLAMDDAYAMQVEVLRRQRRQGKAHAGWKVGQTNAALRAERGEASPAPGFLLGGSALADGGVLDLGGAADWYLEPELALLIGSPLAGADVDAEAARAAVGGVAAAFELVRQPVGWNDRALLRAVNGSNSGYVVAPAVDGCPDPAALDDLRIVLRRDGGTTVDTRAGDVNDNPLDTVAWLARLLTSLGERLEPGQLVLAGSYAGLVPIAAGEHWSADIGDLGTVTLTTR